LNPQPLDLESNALPLELRPLGMLFLPPSHLVRFIFQSSNIIIGGVMDGDEEEYL
jgi:hypothetical protein